MELSRDQTEMKQLVCLQQKKNQKLALNKKKCSTGLKAGQRTTKANEMGPSRFFASRLSFFKLVRAAQPSLFSSGEAIVAQCSGRAHA